MIKLKDLLLEKMSFRDLIKKSDPRRIARAKTVSSKNLSVQSGDNQERMVFSYKSNPSTTGNRHRGYIQFDNEDIKKHNSLEDVNCICECSCPDFKYKYAYGLNKQGVAPIGSTALSTNNGQRPKNFNESNIGICKHLISLGSHLDTGIKAPEPEYNQQKSVEKSIQRNKQTAKPQVTSVSPSPEDDHTSPEDTLEPVTKIRPKYKTPQPKKTNVPNVRKQPNTYTDYDETEPEPVDDRTGELSEDVYNKTNNSLYNRMKLFIKNNPTFEVSYPE